MLQLLSLKVEYSFSQTFDLVAFCYNESADLVAAAGPN